MLKLWDLAWITEKKHIKAPLCYARGLAGSQAAMQEQAYTEYFKQVQQLMTKGQITEALAYFESARSVPGFERVPSTRTLSTRLGARARTSCFREGWLSQTLKAHTIVHSIAISLDGHWAVSGSQDETLKLWDLATGERLHTFWGHSNWVRSIAISPDGRHILSGSEDKTLKLWDLVKGECLCTLSGHTRDIHSVTISPDGHLALSGSMDKTLKLWDLAAGACLRTFEGHKSPVNSVAFSPDGCKVLSGSGDKTLKLWDLVRGSCLRTFEGWFSSGHISSIAISPDGRLALDGSDDQTLKLWDLATGDCLHIFKGHTSWVTSVAFSPDGCWAISGSDDQTLKLWDLATGICLRTFEEHTNRLSSIAFSSDGLHVLSGSWDKTLKLWNLDWDYEFPGWADWDEGAHPYLETFLTLHTPYAGKLSQDRIPSEKEIRLALTHQGKPTWTEVEFQGLLTQLGQRGYGWLREEGVRRKLEEMAREGG